MIHNRDSRRHRSSPNSNPETHLPACIASVLGNDLFKSALIPFFFESEKWNWYGSGMIDSGLPSKVAMLGRSTHVFSSSAIWLKKGANSVDYQSMIPTIVVGFPRSGNMFSTWRSPRHGNVIDGSTGQRYFVNLR